MSQAHAPAEDGGTLSEVDRLFATRDGVRVSNGLGQWSSRIQGIYADGPYVWVQLSQSDQESPSVAVRLPRQTTIAEIIRAFESIRFDDDASTVVRI